VATHQAIFAVGQAVRGLLEAQSRLDDDFKNVDFVLAQASDLQKAAPGETVSLYLYRVAVDGTQRSRPPRVGDDGRRYRPSLPLDLYYLLIPSAPKPDRQQLILGWCMRTLEDAAVLPAGLLNDAVQADVFGPTEGVEFLLDTVSLQDIYNIWDPMKVNFQMSVPYVARVVMLDSATEMARFPPVQTRVLSMREGPPQ
jgi:hypothetical protein